MSDSGFGSISLPGRAAANQALGRGGLALQIINLPNNLTNVAKALRLSGEITQLSTNGVVRIATPEGDIDAQVKNPRVLQTGQKIDIEIPAGRPPQQATLKPPTARPSPQNNPPPTSQRGTQTPQNITTSDTRPSYNAPVNNASRDNYVRPEQNFLKPENVRPTDIKNQRLPIPQQIETARPIQQLPPTALKPDAIVRLIAAPPAQAQQIATEFVQTLNVQPAALTRVPVTANLIVENIQTQILNSALQIKTPPLQPIATNPTQNILAAPPSLLNNNNSFNAISLSTGAPQITVAPASITPPQIIVQQTQIPLISNPAQILQNSALLTPEKAQPLLQSLSTATPTPTQVAQPALVQPIQTTITPAPITFNPNNPIPVQSAPLAKIDIQIVNILPPQPVIIPTTGTLPTIQTELGKALISTTTNTAIISQTNIPPQIIPATTNFTPPVINTNTNAVTLTAQVTGFTPQGLPLITLPIAGGALPQSFVVQFNSNNLQLGSQLQITTQNPVLAQATQTAQPVNPLLRGFQWPALNQLYSALLEISPQAAASLTRALPAANNAAQIAPAAMMFIAAVKSGDIVQWLGQNKADMLQRAGKENILKSLSQDISQSARGSDSSSTTDWRAVPLPMFWEGAIQKINLYTRREFQEDKDKQKNGNGQTRFVFDLELSRMGDMQIDGYLKDQRLDLIIRSQNTFSEPMQQTMRQAYSHALDKTSLTGELNFQGSTKHWVHVLEQQEQLGVHV